MDVKVIGNLCSIGQSHLLWPIETVTQKDRTEYHFGCNSSPIKKNLWLYLLTFAAKLSLNWVFLRICCGRFPDRRCMWRPSFAFESAPRLDSLVFWLGLSMDLCLISLQLVFDGALTSSWRFCLSTLCNLPFFIAFWIELGNDVILWYAKHAMLLPRLRTVQLPRHSSLAVPSTCWRQASCTMACAVDGLFS